MRNSATRPDRTRLTARLRALAPLLVSLAALVWLFSGDIDVLGVVRSTGPGELARLGAAVLAYGALSLAIEACSLVRMSGVPLARFGLWDAARIKAASYLAYVVHYGVGVGALSVLLRRRTDLSLADSAGVVLLIGSFDLGMTLMVATVGALFAGRELGLVVPGVIFAGGATLIVGLIALRSPVSLGPLEPLRRLTVFRATREAPLSRLAELFVLRLVFVLSFFALSVLALRIFDIVPPLAVLVVNSSIVVLVGALPIAVAGLGTSQLAFVSVFRGYGEPETLRACSLALWVALIGMRAGTGLLFAREYAREALQATRDEEPGV